MLAFEGEQLSVNIGTQAAGVTGASEQNMGWSKAVSGRGTPRSQNFVYTDYFNGLILSNLSVDDAHLTLTRMTGHNGKYLTLVSCMLSCDPKSF